MKKIFFTMGYDCFTGINLEGNLFAEFQDDYNLLTIREIENWTEQWSFSLQGIQEEVARIRDDIGEGDTIWVSIQQFEGNEKEGWVTVQADRSSFFRIAYPSGEVTYLGEYMYSACFSPDGKYVAYSSNADYDDEVDMEQEEYERMKKICPPGICVREVEQGRLRTYIGTPIRIRKKIIWNTGILCGLKRKDLKNTWRDRGKMKNS